MPLATKELQREYARAHYAANKEYYRAKVQRNRQKIKDYLRGVKSQPCTDCKQTYPFYVMQFDHLRDKQYTMAKIADFGSLARAKAEVEKCEVVCANCHAARTYLRLTGASE